MRVFIQAHLDTIKQRMQVDIGYGDYIYPEPVTISFPVVLSNMTRPLVNAYTLETVISEKFHAMIELSELNSRMKDFYNVYHFLNADQYDAKILEEAVCATFDNRQTFFRTKHTLFTDEFVNDSQRNRAWQAFQKKIGQDTSLSFRQVVNEITRVLEPIWELLPTGRVN